MFPADHLAIAAVETPHAAAGADIDVVKALRLKLLRAANVVNVVGVAPVDQNVAGLEFRHEFMDHLIDHSGRHHQPDRARLLQSLHEVVERVRARGAFAGKLLHAFRAAVIHDTSVAIFLKPPHHIGTHTPQTDHSQLHSVCSPESNCKKKIPARRKIAYKACVTAFASAFNPDFRFFPR